jgi:hypothetical protein
MRKKHHRLLRQQTASTVTLLSAEELDLKRIAARECGFVLYTQDVPVPGGSERIHIMSLPHEAPRPDMPTPDADPEWFLLSESEMRRIKRVADEALSGIRIRTDENGRLVAEAA